MSVSAFLRDAQALSHSVDEVVRRSIPRFRSEIIAPMDAELKRLDKLRSRALRLQYKVEQLERAYGAKALKVAIERANPQ
jgi:hypothetical protein